MDEHNKLEAKTKIAELVEEYRRKFPKGPLKSFNEENTKDWIDDLFRHLGWNIRNDTVKEESAGRRKRVDYSFKIEGTTQFLLEAKKPSENLDDHVQQAVAYGYYKTKKWVVLTNFEEIRVYNSQYWDQPEEVKRLFSPIKLSEFLERFDDLWVLSKTGFQERLIEQIAKKYGKIKPKEPITKLLAQDLECWRSLLSKNINEHKRLNQLSPDSEEAERWIDEAVQRILDRILFIRVAEDKGIEEPIIEQVLKDWRSNKKKPLSEYLKMAFRTMDDIYNSGLFRPHSSEDLTIDDKILEQVLEETRISPHGLPYDFANIDADILGSVYEQYLSVLLKKTPKRASLKKSESKRKEQGIYYTPTYIVDYIVRNTLGEVLKNMKLEKVDKLKVLDMACGSGSFLLKAFDVLDEHYKKNEKDYNQSKLDENSYAANITRKMQILKNNIYAVDLDPKAVEIAQLNLLLKTAETKHRLPDLGNNIKRGDSLIDDLAIREERAFDWNKNFESIMQEGGFDIILGNPPWVSFGLRGTGTIPDEEHSYYKDKFSSAEYKISIYALFLEQAIKKTKEGGRIGYILPDSFLLGKYFSNLRRTILDCCKIVKIVFFTYDVFAEEATTGRNVIIILEKNRGNRQNNTKILKVSSREDLGKDFSFAYPQQYFEKSYLNRFRLFFSKNEKYLIEKIEEDTTPLEDFVSIYSGCIGRYGQKTIISDEPMSSFKVLDSKGKIAYSDLSASQKWKNVLTSGSEIGRYYVGKPNKYIFIEDDEQLRKIYAKSGFDLWRYCKPRLFLRQTGDSFISAYCEKELYCLNNMHVINLHSRLNNVNIKILMCLLNSKLMNYYYHLISLEEGRTMAQTDIETVEKIPIKILNENIENKLIKYAERMIELNEKLSKLHAKQTDERSNLEKEIAETDRKIDELVYDLYGLTEEERKMVEDSV